MAQEERTAIADAVEAAYRDGPGLAMVDSDRGITSLHVPSDVIIDASMPAAIRSSGQMWNRAGELQDTKFVIPDHSYADLYAETVDDCREHGAFDPATMGTTPNVGLMAQKAEEYGSHDKTFEITSPGVGAGRAERRRRDAACSTTFQAGRHLADVPDQGRPDPRLGRSSPSPAPAATGWPAVFWLDETRAHDAQLLAKVRGGARRARHRRAPARDPGRRATPPGSRWPAPAPARTRSASPATSCATTSPTCSRSWSWARAPRCCRSSR